jgi:hypothetical protein
MSKFCVGDVLRVKKYEDMPHICQFTFVPPMRYLCGRRFTVKGISPIGQHFSEEGLENKDGYDGYWNISADMLEYDDTAPINQPINDINLSEFDLILGCGSG